MLARPLQPKCGTCGNPALQTVRIDVGGRTLLKDLCERHLGELTERTRPRRASHLRLVDRRALSGGL
jgi:hypothetical protein